MRKRILIDRLVSDLSPVKPIRNWIGLWIPFTVVFVWLATQNFMWLRSDLATVFWTGTFQFEMALFLAMTLLATASVFKSYRPGLFSKWQIWFLIPYAVWMGELIYQSMGIISTGGWAAMSVNEYWNCAGLIVFAAALPLAYLVYLTQDGRSTNPKVTGMATFVAAFGAGNLGNLFHCDWMHPTHVVLEHFIPMVLFAVAGYIYGKTQLRW